MERNESILNFLLCIMYPVIRGYHVYQFQKYKFIIT